MNKISKITIIGISIFINLFILKIIFPGFYSPITNLFLAECIYLKGDDIQKLNSFFSIKPDKGDYKYWCNVTSINTRYYNSGSNTLSEVSLKFGVTLPVEIGKLINLRNLELSNQSITGIIPKEFGKLVNIKKLNLSNNNLSGEIPKELSELKELKELLLFKNQFIGLVPKKLSKLQNLEQLDLSYNKFTGEFPIEIIKLENLVFLYLVKNSFSGDVPKIIIK